jgi:acyl carrier protein
MKQYIDLVLSTLVEMGEDDDNEALINAHEKTKIFGTNGVLDSVGIVFLITELEEKISDDFNCDITLADEKAMSQVTSPFRNVETLAKYIEQLVTEG